MLKQEKFPIDKIYVPVKGRKLSNLRWFKKSRRVFWKSDNKLPFLFDPTKTASFWSRGFIGWKRARLLAKKQLSDSWSRLRLHVKTRFYLTTLKQKQNARRWRD